ncbi:MAG: ATP-binding protein [Polyangiales bacterium]
MQPVAVPVVALAGISAHLAVYHLMLFLRRRDGERRDLYFAATAALIALYDVFTVGLYDCASSAEGAVWQRWQLATIGTVSLSLLYFVDAYSGGRGPRMGRFVAWIGPALGLVALVERRGWLVTDIPSTKELDVPILGHVVYHEVEPGPLVLAISTIVPYLAVHLAIVGVRMWRAGGDVRDRAVNLLAGAGLFVFGLANDALGTFGVIHSIYLIEYAWTGMIVLMGQSMMSDVLEAAAAKQALAESRERLAHAERLESVGKLAGGVAHDLNNMLTPVLAYAQLTRRKLPETAREREYVDHIIASAERAAALTQQLLAFGRRQVLEVRPIDLASSLRELDPLLRRLLPETVAFHLVVPERLPAIEADVAQLDQVWMNLVANARDAMPTGGTLELEVREKVASTGERSIVATLEDTGTGMEKAVLDRIFEPFYTTKPKGKGTGLGLATVHGIVKQHGGRIEVESTPGHGTTFRITLPVSEKPAQVRSARPERPAALHGSENILVVDDDPAVPRLVEEVLAQQGYAVRVASSEIELRALLASWKAPIHLLLTDVVMPDIDGPRVHALVAAGHPNVSCIYMSGHAEEVLGPRGVVEGHVHFLKKPFLADDLLAKVRSVLDLEKPRTHAPSSVPPPA